MKQTVTINRSLINYSLVTVFFFALIVLLPANTKVMHDYGLSPAEYRILLFIVELPLAAIWFAAFYGSTKLQAYANTIRNTYEGQGYATLARGFTWLTWGLVLPTIISLIMNSIANSHSSFHTTAIIISNYVSVFFALVAFSLLNNSARTLNRSNSPAGSLLGSRFLLFLFIVFGTLYSYLVLRTIHIDQGLDTSNNPLYLPVWLVIATVMIPNVYAWCLGVLAAYDLSQLAKRAKGVLYRQAIKLLSGGVFTVVISLVAIQYMRSVIPRTGRLSINLFLVALYLIYVLITIGFVMIAVGASRLKKIEDV